MQYSSVLGAEIFQAAEGKGLVLTSQLSKKVEKVPNSSSMTISV